MAVLCGGYDQFAEDSRDEASKTNRQPNSEERNSAWKQIEETEAALLAAYRSLKNHHQSATDLTRFLIGERDQKRKDLQKILETDHALKNFFEVYDRLVQLKSDYFSERLIQQVNCLSQDIFSKSHGFNPEDSIKKIGEQYYAYVKNKDEYGGPKDFLRWMAWRKIFLNARKMAASYEKSIGGHPPKDSGKTGDLIKEIPHLFSFLWSLWTKKNSGPGETPVNDKMQAILRSIGKRHKVAVVWEGYENIPEATFDGKTANIFSYQHSNSFLDVIALAHLPYKGVGMIAAVDLFLPKLIGRRLQHVDHIFPVGYDNGKQGTRFIEAIRSGKLQGGAVSPQGETGTGVYDTSPVQTAYTDQLIARMRKEGLKVNVIPMSFPTHLRILAYGEAKSLIGEPQDKAVGVIHKPITDEDLALLTEATGDNYTIGRVLRGIWIDTAHDRNTEDFILGMPKAETLEQRLDLLSFGPSSSLHQSLCVNH